MTHVVEGDGQDAKFRHALKSLQECWQLRTKDLSTADLNPGEHTEEGRFKSVEIPLHFHANNHMDLGIMSNNAKSPFTSPPFKFIVDGTPIYIHASLISQHSKPLERMINGHMAEAQQGFAELKEVDEGTFIRFVQWAYNGYYSSAEHELKPNDNHKEPTPGKKKGSARCTVIGFVEDSDEEEFLLGSRRKNDSAAFSTSSRQSIREDLKESFIKRKCTHRQNTISIPPPRANKDSTEDYTGVFLCHARLYVFADQYDIQPLKIWAFEELQLTLARYTLYPERTGDIVALMRYIYANTGEPVAGVEDLRTLLTAYLTYEIDTLMKDKAFKELMFEDGGALLRDFMDAVEKRTRGECQPG